MEFKPPTDPALHALWVIRNWTKMPRGNMQSADEILSRVHELAKKMVAVHVNEGAKNA